MHSCQESDQYAKGCRSVSPLPLQMELASALDPARDLQRLHSLILARLQQSDDVDILRTLPFDDAEQAHQTITALTEIAINLDQIHRRYKSLLARETKYGSRQAPIGDDNYLHMIRGGLNSTGYNNSLLRSSFSNNHHNHHHHHHHSQQQQHHHDKYSKC